MTLPYELITMIIEYMTNYRDIYACLCVSKKIHRITLCNNHYILAQIVRDNVHLCKHIAHKCTDEHSTMINEANNELHKNGINAYLSDAHMYNNTLYIYNFPKMLYIKYEDELFTYYTYNPILTVINRNEYLNLLTLYTNNHEILDRIIISCLIKYAAIIHCVQLPFKG